MSEALILVSLLCQFKPKRRVGAVAYDIGLTLHCCLNSCQRRQLSSSELHAGLNFLTQPDLIRPAGQTASSATLV